MEEKTVSRVSETKMR
jgi:hypothetical protein